MIRRVWARPSGRLSSLVRDYRYYRDPGGPSRQHVPSDTLTLIFNLGGELDIADPDRSRRRLRAGEVYLGGLQTRLATTAPYGPQSGIIVGMSPIGAYRLLRGLPQYELLDRSTLVRDTGNVGEQLADAADDRSRFGIVDAFLSDRLTLSRECPELHYAWTRLRRARGRLRIGDLTEELGWSRKRLGERFREYVGLTPKAAARLLRFDHAVSLAEAGGMSWAAISAACGYADQAHLSREVRRFSGRSPRQLSLPTTGTNVQDSWLEPQHNGREQEEKSCQTGS